MKFFVVIIFCVQSLTTSLENTCVVEPLEVNFETVYYKNNCVLILEFEMKLKNNENEITYPRVYTGNKWITLDTESEKTKICMYQDSVHKNK